eukprot:s4326_g1.t1
MRQSCGATLKWFAVVPVVTAAFDNDWPLRQVCSDLGQVKWRQVSSQLWEQVTQSDLGLTLSVASATAMTHASGWVMRQYGSGHRLAEVCWMGVLTLQLWELVMRFPVLNPRELKDEWRLMTNADWSLLLLTEFPIWGVLRQAQGRVTSCPAYTQSPSARHAVGARRCPLPRCDEMDEDMKDQQYYIDAVVNSALAGDEVYMMIPPHWPRCPLGLAAIELAVAVVEVYHFGGQKTWPKLVHVVAGAQRRIISYLEEGLYEAPTRTDDVGPVPADPMGELLSSRWDVVGLLHAMQVILLRSDAHPFRPLPWLVAEAPHGPSILKDTQSTLGGYVRYLLAELRSEFWGAGDGVENFVLRVLHEGRKHFEKSTTRVFVDVGAFCYRHECLPRVLLNEVAKDQRGNIKVYALEPNRRNFLRTQALLRRLPGRWRRHLHLQRAAAGNQSRSQVVLHGIGAKASLKADAYGGLLWRQTGEGRVHSEVDRYVETVSLKRLDHWKVLPRRIEMLKIDVEGSEMDVLQGARSIIEEQRVNSIILEYSHFWSAKLKTLAEDMSAKGYDGYFLGSHCILPFSGSKMEWWHDVYEVCAKIKDRIYRGMAGWCWLNVVFLLRGSRLSRKAWQWVPVEGQCTKTLLGSQKRLGRRRRGGQSFGISPDFRMAEPNFISGGEAFRNIENPRLREPPERLRRRLVAKEDVSTSEGYQQGPRHTASCSSECEVLPGAFKAVPRSKVVAVDTAKADCAAPTDGQIGPRPKAQDSAMLLPTQQVESKYVPPVVIDPKLLWSSCGKPLPPKPNK